MATQKLELTWIGKEKKEPIEPRILIENKKLSYSKDTIGIFDQGTKDNLLIHGDNLLALRSLEKEYEGKVKCIYIDPPYNTGSAFEHYDDNLEHSTWLSLMKERLEILRRLLCDDGSIWIQIDDEEQAYLKVLCDEIFGRSNFINMISVNMKNIAGASGGGEDKRLKKNCEYILIYAKDYLKMPPFKGAYDYEEISELVERYKKEGISWKYTSVFLSEGDKEYITSTVDGDGNEIKIFKHTNYVFKAVSAVAREEHISEKEVYYKYSKQIVRTTMPQSSIRPRVMQKLNEIGYVNDLISIQYVPKTGKNKGTIYTQFYKGDKYNLFAWLSDVMEEKNGKLYKKTLQGTYWDYTAGTKNLTKEGGIQFPNGKKPESLIQRILEMSSEPGDLILDSFLGSGTTAAVAHKMRRRWIGIEMGDQAYTHCKVRLDKIINGEDRGGITEDTMWSDGGGYHFYELAPTLINVDLLGEPIINKEYNPDMLAAAVALHEGFKYCPNPNVFWKQSVSTENSYLFVTTAHLTDLLVKEIEKQMSDDEFLLIACKSFDKSAANVSDKIKIKKIPQMLLGKCEFGKDDYSLNIINPPVYEYEEEECDE